MADYALFFISTLKDYVEHTGDLETGRDLLPVALKQLELSESYFDPETQLVRDGNAKSLTRKKQAEGPELCANMVDQSAFFIDWNLALNKQAAGQAVWIYCAKDALRLMDILGESAGRDDIAARIDGCNEYRILFQIVVPLSLPMMVTLILMMGLGYWNDWMNSLYYVTDEKLFSIQAILNTIITNIQFITSGQGSLASNVDMSKLPSVGVRMAIAIVGIIPVLIIYPFFQKYFVRGIVVGGVKG
ncbi:MAG: carbohydrate ABC transporter permease [Clostridia bacterium]|nr:carbohydrate ABC transporter permease [Clostridia bacterium]